MWIQKKAETPVSHTEKAKGGTGVLQSVEIQNAENRISDNVIGFKYNTLVPGASLGYHKHEGSSETIYVLSGKVRYEDNDHNITILSAGDSAFCADGESHRVMCEGDEPTTFMALILKEQ